MDESFKDLLEDYMDEDEILKKKKLDEMEEEKNIDKCKFLMEYKDYAISIDEFLRRYLKVDTNKIDTSRLTHKNLKMLTIDNPLVVGIYNGYVDIDEIVRRDYLLVYDCFGNIGSYLNPEKLMDLTRLELIRNELKILKKSKIMALEDLGEFYSKFMMKKDEYDYLNLKCSKYYEMLAKSKKRGSIGKIKRYIKKHGNNSLNA